MRKCNIRNAEGGGVERRLFEIPASFSVYGRRFLCRLCLFAVSPAVESEGGAGSS